MLVNDVLLSAVKGYQVHASDEFLKHQTMQLRLDLGTLKQESDRYRKTTSASGLMKALIEKTIAAEPQAKPEDIRKNLTHKVQGEMDEALDFRTDRMEEALEQPDTNRL